MTERDAFIIGVTRYCKKAGLDIDDTEQMTRLLFMPPFRARPIIKRAAVKRAWTFWGGGPSESIWSKIWGGTRDLGHGILGAAGYDPSVQYNKNVADERSIRQQTMSLQNAMRQHPMTSVEAANLRTKIRQTTDPEQNKALRDQYNQLVNEVEPELQQTIDAARQGVVGAQAMQEATPAQIEAGNVTVPQLATDESATGGPRADEPEVPTDPLSQLAQAGKGTAFEGLEGLTSQFAQTGRAATRYRNLARMIQRTHRVSDPRFVQGIDWSDPEATKFKQWLTHTRGGLPTRSGSSAAPQQAATIMSQRGNRQPQQPTSSPPPDVPGSAPQMAAGTMTAVPSRGSMSHLFGPAPGVTPGQPMSTATGGQPPAAQPPATQTPAEMAAFGSDASDQQFIEHPNIQEALRETERYKRMGGSGSVEVGLPSRAGTLNVG